MLVVLKSGTLSLLQDAGRFGYGGLGLTNGGPADAHGFQWANRLCGNDFNATCIEVTLGGLIVKAMKDMVIAITGAPIPVSINDVSLPMWRTVNIKQGQIIKFGMARQGLRAYMAVAGGFEIAPQFGSCATVIRENIGPMQGKALSQGDVLPSAGGQWQKHRQLPLEYIPEYPDKLQLRMLPGYQYWQVEKGQRHRFFANCYKVTAQSDRMGYRLQGEAVSTGIGSLLSEGNSLGAVQIPPDGQPIVLMNDRQTLGGYPKLGNIITADLARLGQCRPGASLSFVPVSHGQAHYLSQRFHQAITETPLMISE